MPLWKREAIIKLMIIFRIRIQQLNRNAILEGQLKQYLALIGS